MERLRKKTVSLIMALFLLINLLPVGAFASDTVTLKLTTEAESAKAGDTVTYSIEVSQNPGLTYLYFGFDYDESQMTLTGFNPTSVFGGTWLPETDVVTMKGANCNLGTTNVTATGVVATVTFTVADTVKDGDKIKLELLCDPYSEWGDTMNSKDEPVPVDLTGASCMITVAGGGENPNVPVTGVKLDKTTLELTEGQEEQLTATVDPETATTRTVKWTSNSEQVTVDENGKVKALNYTAGSTGKATITVTTDDGAYTATCEVTVKHANLQKVGEQPASCTGAGQKAHWFCDTCGLYYLIGDNDTVGEETTADKVIIPASPHTLEPVAEKAATCTTGGNVAYWKCSVCGAMFKDANGNEPTNEENVKTPANGHAWSSGWSKDENNHWHECTACHEKEPDTEKPHSWVVVKKNPNAEGSYEENSPTHEVKCSECGALKNEDHEGDDITTAWEHDENHHWHVYGCGTIMKKESHTWDTGKVTKAATCTEKGETTYTCKCGETKTEEDIPAKGHQKVLNKTDAIPATCTTGGNDAYWTCPDCGTYFSDEGGQNVIEKDSWIKEKLGHDFGGEWFNGGDGHYQKCLRAGCGAKSDLEPHRFDPKVPCDEAASCLDGCGYVRPAGTHTWGKPDYKWTKTEDGYTCTGKAVCDTCGDNESETAAVTDAVTTQPTCTQPGVKTFTATFIKAPFETQTTTEPVTTLAPHTMVKTEAKAATCVAAGNNAYWTCSVCKGVFKDELGKAETTVKAETLTALGHDFGGTWFNGGDGHYQKCLRAGCGAKSDLEPHRFDPKVPCDEAASCLDGCGYVRPAGTHTWGKPDYKWTKTEDGYTCTGKAVCDTCGDNESETAAVTDAVTTQPTCTQPGVKTFTATFIKAPFETQTTTEPVTTLAPHTMVKTEAKAATCVAAGNNAYWSCSVCKGVFKDELGKTATTVEAETLPIDPANHTGNTELRDAVTATCNMSGHEADTYCKDCGVLLSRGATIPATGKHTYGEDGRCTSCGNVNPAAGVNTDDIKAADTVNGTPVSPDNSGKVIASNDGKTVIRTPAAADDNTVQQVKDALTGGSVTLYVDNRKTEALTGSDGGVAALEALAASASGERKQELEKLAEALKALLNDSGRKNAAGQMVYDGEMQLCDANGVPVAELVQSPNSIQVTLPITEAQYQAMQGKKVCVLRSSTDASGAAAVTELSATVGGSQSARVLSFSTDKGGALALAVYETVSSGGGSSGGSGSSTAPRTADAGVTVWCALLGISALLGTALVAKKRRQA